MDNLIFLAIIILGLAGLSVATNIRIKKATQKPMICPLNMKCEQVLYSKYAKFLGIPLEILGILYYSIVAISYGLFLYQPEFKNPLFTFSIFIVSAGGFVFSIYLVSLQAFKLKEWCSWCLMSALISTSIFILSLQTNAISVALTALSYEYRTFVITIYAMAISLGLGLSIVSEILFLRFLKDLRISNEESSILNILRQMVWAATGITVISNYSIYLMDKHTFSNSDELLFTIALLTILVIINLIYDLFISSKLIEIYSDIKKTAHMADNYLRAMPFIFSPLSLISWFAIFFLEMVKGLDLTFLQLTIIYITFGTIAIMTGGTLGLKTLRR